MSANDVSTSTSIPPSPLIGAAERRYLHAFTDSALPRSPRPIAEETLASYMERLAYQFRLPIEGVYAGLGLPTSIALETLERGDCTLLVDRLAAATARSRERFLTMQFAPGEPVLCLADRDAYCPSCWRTRRKFEAAFLSREWARPHAFFCHRHEAPRLLQVYPFKGAKRWGAFFMDRSAWDDSEETTLWQRVHTELGLDSLNERRLNLQWLKRYEDTAARTTGSVATDDEFRMVTDLANHWQIAWKGTNAVGALSLISQPIRDPYDDDVCYARVLVGSLGARLQTLIVARHLLATIRGQRTKLWGLIDGMRHRKRTCLESWWLRRRFLRWPSFEHERAIDFFGLWRDDTAEMPVTEACQRCVKVADPPLKHNWLYVYLTPSFRCQFEPKSGSREIPKGSDR